MSQFLNALKELGVALETEGYVDRVVIELSDVALKGVTAQVRGTDAVGAACVVMEGPPTIIVCSKKTRDAALTGSKLSESFFGKRRVKP